MTGIRIMAPKATTFTTTVEVPVRKLMVGNNLTDGKDIFEVEHAFTEMTHTQNDSVMKSDYDLCRLTLKWAYSCNASLESVSNVLGKNKAVKFVFSFNDMNNLTDFVKDLRVNVH